ncbi:pentapeptide repeat-containing protein [Nocardia sp. NPDC005746]|uniref:pentapeptide repeat-containing protein n=1 Tax=Nocardia sp. NPDC005746 TaxID=3157062 RepID=UPI0033FE1C89
MSTPAPRRRLNRVTGGLRQPRPTAPPPSPLSGAGSRIVKAATWDGWLKLGAVVTAVGVLIGLYFTNQTLRAAGAANTSVRQTQVTDRFTKAVEALDNTGLNARIGGIYSLEQLAKDEPSLRSPIVEVLATFIRTKTHVDKKEQCNISVPVSTEVQAAMTVIGRRTFNAPEPVDLRNTCLPYLDLNRANLYGLVFKEANLHGASMRKAAYNPPIDQRSYMGSDIGVFINVDLTDVDLWMADLRNVTFNAKMDGAVLTHANLGGAVFDYSQLTKAVFYAANLAGACFQGGDIKGAGFSVGSSVSHDLDARNLDQVSFVFVQNDETTTWPVGFRPTIGDGNSQPCFPLELPPELKDSQGNR